MQVKKQVENLLLRADPTRNPARAQLYISEEGWLSILRATLKYGYKGRGEGQGVSAYLRALFQANPATTAANPTDTDLSEEQLATLNKEQLEQNWTDTRPEELTQSDLYRLEHNQLPLWNPEGAGPRGTTVALARNIRLDCIAAITPHTDALSDYFGIKSPPLNTQRANCGLVLDCIGLSLLTPTNHPARCTVERDPNHTRQAIYRERWRRKQRGVISF